MLEASPMPQDEPIPGPIEGLRLPARVWTVLEREHITTLDQLRAAAGRIERFENVGPKTARIIRAELARVVPADKPRHHRPGS
jgi:hypothetical protein